MKNSKKQVFGRELNNVERNELALIIAVVKGLEGRKGLTFDTVLNKAKALRPTAKFALTPYNELTKDTARNFRNRIAKTLGGTKEYGYSKNTAQAIGFNIEIATNLTVKFLEPLDYTKNLSPQVKRSSQRFDIKGRPTFSKKDIEITPEFLAQVEASREAV